MIEQQMSETWRDALSNSQTTPKAPVDAQHAYLVFVILQRILQAIGGLFYTEAQHPLALESFAELLALGQVSNLSQVSPVHDGRG